MNNVTATIVFAIVLSGCMEHEDTVPTLEEATKIVDRVEATFTSGDPVRIMEHYAPNAVFFDASHNEPTNDRATATKWTESFVALKPRAFSPGTRILQVISEDVFISSGIATIEIEGSAGPQKIRIRYTDVYEEQPDGFMRIVNEHLSNLPNPPPK